MGGARWCWPTSRDSVARWGWHGGSEPPGGAVNRHAQLVVHRVGRADLPAAGLLAVWACWWAISQLRAEYPSISGLARQLGTTWRTVWRRIAPVLEAMADDPSRFDGVTSLGVDEHLWHHVDERHRPRALTGMVDLTRDQHGQVKARLLDLVPGRTGSLHRLAPCPR